MKTIILTTLMVITTSTAFAGKDCGSSNSIQLLSSAAEDIAAQAAKDERVVVDRTSAQYKQLNAIGKVEADGQNFYGTGFLVDACHVLTNNHVVYKDPKSAKKGTEVKFTIGSTEVSGKTIDNGGFENTRETQNSDWAIVRLSKPLGATYGYIPMYQMDMQKMNGLGVITAGFPGSKTNGGKDLSKIYGDLNCKVTGTSGFGYSLHTCQATGGQSGSPVMAKGNDGKYYAVAMISGNKGFNMDRTEDPDKANVAVNFTSGKSLGVATEGDKINAALKADPCN